MSIDAFVEHVSINEDGTGYLSLIDRAGGGVAGQHRLSFEKAPYTVTSLNWCNVWGGGSQLMLGDKCIARREGYTRVVFVSDAEFNDACRLYREKQDRQ